MGTCTVKEDGMATLKSKRHIESLISHGAELVNEDGRIPLTMDFYENAVKSCGKLKINAATFEIALPGIEERMGLTIWKDGHADSGSMETLQRCLDAR